MRSAAVLSLVAALALARAPSARAEIALSPRSGWYLPVGAVIGESREGGHASLIAGAELSLVRLWAERRLWAGIYSDGVWQRAPGVVRLSLGPEIGAGVVGADLGYVCEVGSSIRQGLQLRGVLTLAFVGFYGRFVHLATDNRNFAEFGVLLKLPFTLGDQGAVPPPIL